LKLRSIGAIAIGVTAVDMTIVANIAATAITMGDGDIERDVLATAATATVSGTL
jgi:hypothetical protein